MTSVVKEIYSISEIYSSLAQSVEHSAVNRRVVGSSPTGGANRKVRKFLLADFFVLYYVSDRSPMLLFLYSSNPRRIVRNPY